jgi:hypothetical protein
MGLISAKSAASFKLLASEGIPSFPDCAVNLASIALSSKYVNSS